MPQNLKYWTYDPDLEARINPGKNRLILELPVGPKVDAMHLRSQLEHVLFETARGERFLAALDDYGFAIVTVNVLSGLRAGAPGESP